ncbi:3'(2'),5'-bisphosphate nucleotidase CysQ [Aquamicrobium sp. LC103]|uniref:3'(2'),5'-bisphosphate nucleotidase CysQ n=1 Tax=Aquamicrobium sp. LC103 TaxID=1120658 RepID=UPI001FED57D8|nr:3'(2'),5'-bisphosphate nucleotidase CysQ [Aquamicrobium sp. LC103]
MSDATAGNLAGELALIRDAAREAGDIAMRYFRKDPDVWMKEGSSPVSEADMAVDRFLRETLLRARPDYGWLSEETVDDKKRLEARRTFVVDPIDGTRAFIAGNSTWCVSIAVVEDGASLVGVLDCPAKQEVYLAMSGGPATRNGVTLAVNPPHARPVIGGPKQFLDRAPAHIRGPTLPYVPSLAYRIAMVAGGEIDATFIKPNSHDWDLAAADLILRRAGGTVLDPSGQPPRYAGPEPRHGALVAGSGRLVREMAEIVAGFDT